MTRILDREATKKKKYKQNKKKKKEFPLKMATNTVSKKLTFSHYFELL